jgi:LemA protein
MIFLVILFIVALVLLFMGVSIYNGLVSLKNQIDRSWANIEVILKQRFDEIPQLIQVVEQYAGYEQATLKKVIEARNTYNQATTTDQKVEAANLTSIAFKGLAALGESYPDLKANTNFIHLQGRVSDLESQLADRRENFNETVTNFNTRIQQIPDVFFARMLGYNQHSLFKVEAAETVRPSLKMNFN